MTGISEILGALSNANKATEAAAKYELASKACNALQISVLSLVEVINLQGAWFTVLSNGLAIAMGIIDIQKV